jgi:hypothetical protein
MLAVYCTRSKGGPPLSVSHSRKETIMHVEFQIEGRYQVPLGTEAIPGTQNQFRLPTGQVVSVYPVIEMASSVNSDDHRDLNWSEAHAIGISLDIYDRASDLVLGDSA